MISEGDRHFLVDAGGGNQILKRLKDAGVRLEDLHDIFLTHEHIDHLLGLIWLIRMAGQMMDQGKYDGEMRIYCHSGLIPTIRTIASLTIQKKVTEHIGERILLIPLEDGEKKTILGCEAAFFDIGSTKAKQYGFTMLLPDGRKLTCCGDEPYHSCEYEYVKGSDYLMHEAFCLYEEADRFKPYEKHHSTVREACELAEKMGIPNLILYHTEESHQKEESGCIRKKGNGTIGGIFTCRTTWRKYA